MYGVELHDPLLDAIVVALRIFNRLRSCGSTRSCAGLRPGPPAAACSSDPGLGSVLLQVLPEGSCSWHSARSRSCSSSLKMSIPLARMILPVGSAASLTRSEGLGVATGLGRKRCLPGLLPAAAREPRLLGCGFYFRPLLQAGSLQPLPCSPATCRAFAGNSRTTRSTVSRLLAA